MRIEIIRDFSKSRIKSGRLAKNQVRDSSSVAEGRSGSEHLALGPQSRRPVKSLGGSRWKFQEGLPGLWPGEQGQEPDKLGFWAGRCRGRVSGKLLGLESVCKIIVEKVLGPNDLAVVATDNCPFTLPSCLHCCLGVLGRIQRGISGCFGSSALFLPCWHFLQGGKQGGHGCGPYTS